MSLDSGVGDRLVNEKTFSQRRCQPLGILLGPSARWGSRAWGGYYNDRPRRRISAYQSVVTSSRAVFVGLWLIARSCESRGRTSDQVGEAPTPFTPFPSRPLFPSPVTPFPKPRRDARKSDFAQVWVSCCLVIQKKSNTYSSRGGQVGQANS